MPKDNDKPSDSVHLLVDNEQESDNTMGKRVNTRVIVAFVLTLLLKGIRKFWALCTTCLLILLLMYFLYGGLVTLTLILLAICGLLYNLQDKLLYYPDQPSTARLFVESPAALGLSFENIFVKTSDGVRINLLFLKAPVMTKAPTVIYFHGNAGNVGHRLFNAFSLVTSCGCNVLLVEYRGYGKSQGSPSEAGLYKDAAAAMDFCLKRKDIDLDRIVVFGRSLGGAVAIKLAGSQRYASNIYCLIVENTFTSLPDIGRHIFEIKLIEYVPDICIKNKYPSQAVLSKVQVPTLFLSGMADSLIPPRMMKQLYSCSGSRLKRLARFNAGTHNETWQCTGYYESINRFFQEVDEAKATDSYRTEAAYNIQVPFDDGGGAPVLTV